MKRALTEDEKAALDVLKTRFERGDGMALFDAMEECALRGWLLPSWAHGAFLAGLERFRRGAVKDLGDAFGVQPQSMKRAHRAALVPMPAGGGWRLIPASDYVVRRFPALKREEAATRKKHLIGERSELALWDALAAEMANNLKAIGWPRAPYLSARTLKRIWTERKSKK